MLQHLEASQDGCLAFLSPIWLSCPTSSPPSNRSLGTGRVGDRCFHLLCLPGLAASQCIPNVTPREQTITHPIQEASAPFLEGEDSGQS